jgi:hypothetical protein
MAAKTRSECSAEESLRYLSHYFATVDVVTEALGKYEVLATDSQTASARSLFRAKALEALRDLELLKNQRRAFLAGEAAIKPPSQSVVDAAVTRAEKLAAILADEAQATSIIQLTTQGLDAFNKIHAA